MSSATFGLPKDLHAYLLDVSLREHPAMAALRAETAKMEHGAMQISPEQGQFMALLAEMLGARRTFEVGTFTGYSALAMALALPADGQVIACDVSDEWTAVGRPYWQQAGVADKIDLRLGPALDTLDALIADGQVGSFDMAFIDADKENYDGYYERALVLVRQGGLILIDNVLWSGRVIDETNQRDHTKAIRALNLKLRDDDRVTLSLVPIGDGLTLARKR